jgi:hypothetical protein
MHVIRTAPFYKGVDLNLKSPVQSSKLIFTPDSIINADGLDQDPAKDCGQGINFCRSITEALKWGPRVVEIFIPDRTTVIDTGQKLRAKKVRVGKEISLAGANLAGASLSGADLSGAYLSGANLSRANLSRANLSRTNLYRTNLYRANLSGAYLYRADLYRADLSGADLSRANLAGASLAGASLAGADLSKANHDSTTVWPKGFKP